jgi:hypothetical protein
MRAPAHRNGHGVVVTRRRDQAHLLLANDRAA